MPDGLPAALDLVLPTDLVFVRAGRKMVEGLLIGQGWPEEDVEEAGLVVSELIQNAIEHGSLADGSETARLSILLAESTVALEVADPGTGKDPQGLLDYDVEAVVPLDEPRGRGLFLINRLASRFERDRVAGGGCLVRVYLECCAE
jgi:anti-sigma regulatory factor (Ser/Thr protein kinase)